MTATDGKPYVVRQTRSVVKPGTFGGNHPKHSAIRDHCDTIGDLLHELCKDEEISWSEYARLSEKLKTISDWAFAPIRADANASIERNRESTIGHAVRDVGVSTR